MNITGKKQPLSPSVFLSLLLSVSSSLPTIHRIPIDTEMGLESQEVNSNFFFCLVFQTERVNKKGEK